MTSHPILEPPRHGGRVPALTADNRRWWTLGAMCFALFMLMLDNTVVNVALPTIQRSLGLSIGGLEWTVNAYTLTFAVLLVTGGRLGDIFGRRRWFLIGVVIFAGSSAFIGLAQSSTWLIGGRAVQGIGAALMMPATLSIVTNAFPPQERGKAIGTWAAVSALALAIGPVVGGFLVEHVSWQSIFFLNVPVAILAVIVTFFAAEESRDESATHTVDYAGVAGISVGLGALVLALIEGNGWGWGSVRILSLLALSVAGLAAFTAVELRSPEPMIDFRFFRGRTYLGANLVGFLTTFAMLAMFFFLALYMQNVKDYSPLEAGVRFLPATMMIIVVAPLAGRLTDRIGARPLITAGLLLVAGSLFWQGHLSADTGYVSLALPFVLMGTGMGLVMPPMTTAGMNAVEQSKAGVASGILSTSRMVGGTFGVAAMGALITGVGRHRLDELLPGVPSSHRAQLAESLGSGGARFTGQIGGAVRDAFIHGLNTGLRVGAAVAGAGALLAWLLIAGREAHPSPERPGASTSSQRSSSSHPRGLQSTAVIHRAQGGRT
jgi:EmrB/QacA subfamily drug resistance transporter